MDRAAKEMQAAAAMFATGGERIVDYRDLPPEIPATRMAPWA